MGMGMGVDILLCIILVGLFAICGGFGSYGMYRCCTDKESRVSSENSLRKGDVTKINRKPGFLSLFRKRDKREQYSRNSSLSSFAGTIYTVSSGSSLGGVDRQTDGKVPFDLLGDPKLTHVKTVSSLNGAVGNWALENEVDIDKRKGILKSGATRATTAPT